MKILVIADEEVKSLWDYYDREKTKDVDLIISCGDLKPQYLEFLESRCFPKSRDKMKLVLKDLRLPFYDPIMIIEKTEGRMAEDDFWIRIER